MKGKLYRVGTQKLLDTNYSCAIATGNSLEVTSDNGLIHMSITLTNNLLEVTKSI